MIEILKNICKNTFQNRLRQSIDSKFANLLEASHDKGENTLRFALMDVRCNYELTSAYKVGNSLNFYKRIPAGKHPNLSERSQLNPKPLHLGGGKKGKKEKKLCQR